MPNCLVAPRILPGIVFWVEEYSPVLKQWRRLWWVRKRSLAEAIERLHRLQGRGKVVTRITQRSEE